MYGAIGQGKSFGNQ